ncbi:hypothetical protein KZX37_12375 [Microbacterium sp. EYE_5]|uniref:DUF7882 family protein n=1 Tax=unclassified Microbacterium TaxID=2609290 RepID=UPI002002AADA|nr:MULTISPECIES: hypothetical protein [unclassified Microbacterium]MCK6080690.1 hypothetical protein [Microbacterium sp. EYE_382]MCK6085961.1 hypothetical protein [Microbacterium sp. EYE_384]MCK6124541.1 hypothetical protein [Microbacterium sp. EYE_80]MCK6127450.1 hypothetical protein [Microbacterium sp. EYE_79]MCK6141645.1 hypothetical protein [Microbacterium sp. EYE_39]
MGLLTYNNSTRFEIDDRTIAHVEAVVYAKLRRGEPFLFTWNRAAGEGSGRTTVWISRGARLVFRRRWDTRIPINPEWIARLMSAANSPQGLHELPEPEAAEAAG